MSKAPWEFSGPHAADDTLVPNTPTEEGRALGAQMARLCDNEEPKIKARFPKSRPRCNDCAFRAGTDPNGCEETLMDALKCVVESVPFYCHLGMAEGDPKRLCAGFSILVRAELPDLAGSSPHRTEAKP